MPLHGVHAPYPVSPTPAWVVAGRRLRHLLFGFQGRTRRLHFALVSLFWPVAIGIPMAALHTPLLAWFADSPYAPAAGFLCIVLWLWPLLANTVKRLHDIDESAWSILWLVVPFANLWVSMKLAFLPGDLGSNRFGPDPKGGW